VTSSFLPSLLWRHVVGNERIVINQRRKILGYLCIYERRRKQVWQNSSYFSRLGLHFAIFTYNMAAATRVHSNDVIVTRTIYKLEGSRRHYFLSCQTHWVCGSFLSTVYICGMKPRGMPCSPSHFYNSNFHQNELSWSEKTSDVNFHIKWNSMTLSSS